MNTAFVGMDPHQARAHSASVLAGVSLAKGSVSEASALVASLNWVGTDRDAFVAGVESTVLVAAHDALTILADYARDLELQAAAQEAASAPLGLGAGHRARLDGGADAPARPLDYGVPHPMGEPVTRKKVHATEVLFALGARSAPALDAALDSGHVPPELRGIARLASDKLNLVYDADFVPSDIVAATEHHSTITPSSPAELAQVVEDARTYEGGGPDRGNLRIMENRTASGDASYTVFLPPTSGGLESDASLGGTQGNARDWQSNIHQAGGVVTPAQTDVVAAMEEFGVPKGSPVLLVGHSQGGMVGSKLAANPDVNGQGAYNITDVLSIGGPTDNDHPAQTGTRVFGVEHRDKTPGLPPEQATVFDPNIDIVPLTDLGGLGLVYEPGAGSGGVGAGNFGLELGAGDQVTKIYLDSHDGGASFYESLEANHDSVRKLPSGENDPHYGYIASLEREQATHPGLVEAQERFDGVYTGEDVQVVRDVTYAMVSPSKNDTG